MTPAAYCLFCMLCRIASLRGLVVDADDRYASVSNTHRVVTIIDLHHATLTTMWASV